LSKLCTLVLHTKQIVASNTYDKSISYKSTYELVPTDAPFRPIQLYKIFCREELNLIGKYDVFTIDDIEG
jgi:hypothetical protein